MEYPATADEEDVSFVEPLGSMLHPEINLQKSHPQYLLLHLQARRR